jgi:hypothetical protein
MCKSSLIQQISTSSSSRAVPPSSEPPFNKPYFLKQPSFMSTSDAPLFDFTRVNLAFCAAKKYMVTDDTNA